MSEFMHSRLGFCIWDIPTLIVFAVLVTILVVHIAKQKKRERALEKELEEKKAVAKTNTAGSSGQ